MHSELFEFYDQYARLTRQQRNDLALYRDRNIDRLYAGLRLRVRISLRLVQRREVERIQETVAEHIAIAQAILSGSGDAAVAALEKHLRRGHELTTANLDRIAAPPRASKGPLARSALARPRGRPTKR